MAERASGTDEQKSIVEKAIVSRHPWVPLRKLKQEDGGTYLLVDQHIALVMTAERSGREVDIYSRKVDAQEYDPETRPRIEEVKRSVAKRLERMKGQVGYGGVFADELKKELRDRFKIDWKTPEELSPGVHLD